jgi:hypothetical protein
VFGVGVDAAGTGGRWGCTWSENVGVRGCGRYDEGGTWRWELEVDMKCK